MLFSEFPINDGTYINILDDINTKELLQINNETIYYALSSLSYNIIREYI